MNASFSPVDPEAVRIHMRQWTSGVTIVSSAFGGIQHGMTVSSFTSLSLEPPLVLVSLSRLARTYHLVQASGVFAVTILGRDQQDVSERFAGRTPEDEDRFAGLDTFTLRTGAPLLAGGLAFFDCRVQYTHDFGDNTLFVGEVVAADGSQTGEPLVYYDRDYRRLA